MQDSLLTIIFSPINFALSALLILLVIYWIFSLLLGLDFDVDFDVDIDIDVDVDVDPGVGMDGSNVGVDDLANAEIKKENVRKKPNADLKWWQVVLVFFNFVELPFMFTFTFWILFWWFLTVGLTILTGSYNNFFGLIMFLVAIIPSLFLTKIFTFPFKRVFKNFEKNGVEQVEIVGRSGVALSNISGDKIGSVKLVIDSSPFSIYGKSIDGKRIETGQNVLVIKESSDKKYYYISTF